MRYKVFENEFNCPGYEDAEEMEILIEATLWVIFLLLSECPNER
jgi:hypothetical protein